VFWKLPKRLSSQQRLRGSPEVYSERYNIRTYPGYILVTCTSRTVTGRASKNSCATTTVYVSSNASYVSIIGNDGFSGSDLVLRLLSDHTRLWEHYGMKAFLPESFGDFH